MVYGGTQGGNGEQAGVGVVCEKELDGEVKAVPIWGDIMGIEVKGGEEGG